MECLHGLKTSIRGVGQPRRSSGPDLLTLSSPNPFLNGFATAARITTYVDPGWTLASVPRDRAAKPDPERLEHRYAQSLEAS